MSSGDFFSSVENKKMLWEILTAQLNINSNTDANNISNIRNIFDSNVTMLNSKNDGSRTLMAINKQFLSQTLECVHKLLPWTQSKIKITNIDASEDVNVVHQSKHIQFSDELGKMQQNFDEYLTPKRPENIDFSDKSDDNKIKNIDELLSQTIKQRNYDVPEVPTNVDIGMPANDDDDDVGVTAPTEHSNKLSDTIKYLRETANKLNNVADEWDKILNSSVV